MTVKTSTTSFEALLADLGTMAKAIDVNQERIEAGRSAEGHMQSGDSMTKGKGGEGESEEEKKKREEKEERERLEKAGGKGGEKGEMCKSFTMQTADGKTIEVQDASELVKSLTHRLETTEASILQTFEGCADLINSQSDMIKSLTDKVLAQDTALSEQSTLIKSLQNDVKAFGNTGSGRRATLSIVERSSASSPSTNTLAKSGIPEGITQDVFFAKAMQKQEKGLVSGFEISLAETQLQKGLPLSEELVVRVMAA